jgi:hypothetical protein
MQRTDKPVIASGGISSLEDLEKLRALVPLGLEGAILGKSLYAGKFTLEQALKVAGSLTPQVCLGPVEVLISIHTVVTTVKPIRI